MFEVITLASGSDGNATLVRNETATFLIDAGLSARQLTARLLATGTSPEQLSGILLTHEHGDHTSALKVLLMRHQLPVFCNSPHRPGPPRRRARARKLEAFSNRLGVLARKLRDPRVLCPT